MREHLQYLHIVLLQLGQLLFQCYILSSKLPHLFFNGQCKNLSTGLSASLHTIFVVHLGEQDSIIPECKVLDQHSAGTVTGQDNRKQDVCLEMDEFVAI